MRQPGHGGRTGCTRFRKKRRPIASPWAWIAALVLLAGIIAWGGRRLGWWFVRAPAPTDREVAEAAWRGTAEILNEWAEERREARERVLDRDPDLAYETAYRSSNSDEVLRLLRRHEGSWRPRQRDSVLRKYVTLLHPQEGRSFEEVCDDEGLPEDIRRAAWRAWWELELRAWQSAAEKVSASQRQLLHSHFDHQRDLEVGPHASTGLGARGDVPGVKRALAESERALAEWDAKQKAARAGLDALREHPLACASEQEKRMVAQWERDLAQREDAVAEWKLTLDNAEKKTIWALAEWGPRNKRLLADWKRKLGRRGSESGDG